MGIFTKERPNALIASARRLNLGDRTTLESLRRRTEQWQDDCWGFYDNVPELKYALGTYLANSLSRLTLYVDERQEDGSWDRSDNETAIAALERIASSTGHSELLRYYGINVSVVGECYLIGTYERTEAKDGFDLAETWAIYSADDVQFDAMGKATVPLFETDRDRLTLKDDDFFVRLWLRHPRKASQADSPVRGCRAPCEELLHYDRVVRNANKSRFASAGVFAISEKISFRKGDGEKGTEADEFIDELYESMQSAIQNEDSASAVIPIVVQVAGQEVDKAMKHITFERPVDEKLDQRRESARTRLAQGINMPAEILTGKADVNHWTAWQIGEEAGRIHVEPVAADFCNSVTVGYFHGELIETGIGSDQVKNYRVWYDPSELYRKVNRAEDAKDAHGMLIISDQAAREAMQFTDEDAPDEAELERRLKMKLNPAEQLPDDEETVEEDPGPPDDEQPEEEPVTSAARPRDNGKGRKALEIDRTLRNRLQVAADAQLVKALERAGARLRPKVRKDASLTAALDGKPNVLVASILGPSVVKQVLTAAGMSDEELIDSFDALRPQWDAWVDQAQSQSLGLVDGLTPGETRTARRQQEDDREEGWAWFAAALLGLAQKRLFDPKPEAPEVGEFDASVAVPYGLVREAVARAGGASGLEVVGEVALSRGSAPVGGIATGERVINLFEAHGEVVEAYQWVYGVYPRSRPFEPHMALDGLVFNNFDDASLTNTEGWPPVSHFVPGDHAGCVCDFMPIISRVQRRAA